MVERPIKKSERQAIADAASPTEGETVETESRSAGDTANGSPQPRNVPRPTKGKKDERSKDERGKDKGRGKGRGKSRGEDEPARPANLATQRGPRPVKAQEPVVEEVAPESTDETTPESADESTAEATEAVESTEA
ncbi:MAG TPA: hypothetical protein V6C78_20505 [Crinalium sp.]|jgi:hypothetical protein